MTDYKAIHGKNVLHVSSDLGAEGEGEIWFNTASGDYKTIVKVAGAWASGGNLVATKAQQLVTAGTQTAAITVGRSTAPAALAETYDGSSWTEVGDLNSARGRGAGAGTQTAAIGFGGVLVPPDATIALNESWNGSSWTEVGDLPAAKADHQGCGTSTAALSISGTRGEVVTTTESWNGTSWTAGTVVNTGRDTGAAAGIQTSAMFVGGSTGSDSALHEYWNGSSWTELADLNTAKSSISAFGISTSALAVRATTETWDGSSWTEVADMSTGGPGTKKSGGAGASGVSGLIAGGGSPRGVHTEEWDWTSTATPPGAQNIKIITD